MPTAKSRPCCWRRENMAALRTSQRLRLARHSSVPHACLAKGRALKPSTGLKRAVGFVKRADDMVALRLTMAPGMLFGVPTTWSRYA